MTKKHPFHCQKCNSECKIYHKGKKHRVFVCPICGILATNPFSFKSSVGGAGAGAAVGTAFLPGVGTAIGAGIGGLLTGLESTPTEKKQNSQPYEPCKVRQSYSLERRYHDAMR